jgi:2-dehydro-3-deoxy-L-rhamnonate dehydrogenase (NAD+)
MFLQLDNRIALVTGAAQGIGYAIASRFVEAGATVVIVDRDAAATERAVTDLRAMGGQATGAIVDITDTQTVNRLIADAEATHGGVDILVNNAGITGANLPLWECTDEEWDRVMTVNLTAVFRLCRAAVPGMRARKRGAIVNIASIAGKEGNPNLAPYSATKAAVIGLTKALAKEVIADGVRVNAVAPAVIATPLLTQLTPEVLKNLTSRIPMGRMGTPEEVAAVVHFLASDDASFVTGQCYDASGGRATY